MNFLRKLWQRIINPSLIQGLSVLFVGSVFVADATVLILRRNFSPGTYMCCAFAALSMVYIIYILVYAVPRVKMRTLEIAEKYEFAYNMVKNYGFRTMVFALGSLILNMLYCVYNGAVALYYYSTWYSALFAYYLFLCVMRGGLIIGTRKDNRNSGLTDGERAIQAEKKYVWCGALLLAFTAIVVAGIVRLTVYEKNQSVSQGLIYPSALHMIIRMSLAVKNIFKARKGGDPVTRALRNVGFADALVSTLSLQTAILSIGIQDAGTPLVNALSGGVVCALISFIGIRMIIRGKHAIKSIRSAVNA